MEVLKQIENLMSKMKGNHENSIIVKFEMYLSFGDIYYKLTFMDGKIKGKFEEKDIKFDSLEKLTRYLNKNSWKIKEEVQNE